MVQAHYPIARIQPDQRGYQWALIVFVSNRGKTGTCAQQVQSCGPATYQIKVSSVLDKKWWD
jgi:hypothetical protein